MDVSAIASGAGTPAPVASDQTANSPPVQQAGSQPAVAAIQGVTQQQQQLQQQQPQQQHQQSGIAPAVAKLFGGGSSPQPVTLNVSYKVVGPLDEIVTVFSDPKTGREIAQFPPDLLIGLAEFFDQKDGVTLDKTA